MTNFMQIAIEEAQKAAMLGEVPVGAVIVHKNTIIAKAFNHTEEYADPTAHAEMLAIQAACKILGAPRIPDCDLYVTLEPCTMCAAAISFARIRNLYYGASDAKMGGVYTFLQPTCHHKPQIYEGIAASESAKLLQDFFAAKR